MKANYHTHTFYCGHAVGTVDDYVEEAIEKGFDVLGMSEHSYVPNKPGLFLNKDTVKSFFSDCENAREKYKDKITLKIGEEIDFFPDSIEYYKELRKHVDFLGLSLHFYDHLDSDWHNYSSFGISTVNEAKIYAKNIILGIETEIFDFVCHPDLFMLNLVEWTDEIDQIMRSIIEAAIKHHIPLELNVNGLRRRPVMTSKGLRHRYCREEYLALLKEYNANVIIGSDAHQPSQLDDSSVQLARDLAKEYDLHVVTLEK